MDKTNINNSTPMEDMTIGGTIYNAGNSREVKTGDWRIMIIVKDVAFVPKFVLSKQSQWKRRELNNEY